MNFTFRGNVFKVSAIRKPELPMAAMFFYQIHMKWRISVEDLPFIICATHLDLYFLRRLNRKQDLLSFYRQWKYIHVMIVLHIRFLWRKCTNNSDVLLNWLITTVVKFSIRIHATFLTPVIKIFLTLWS